MTEFSLSGPLTQISMIQRSSKDAQSYKVHGGITRCDTELYFLHCCCKKGILLWQSFHFGGRRPKSTGVSALTQMALLLITKPVYRRKIWEASYPECVWNTLHQNPKSTEIAVGLLYQKVVYSLQGVFIQNNETGTVHRSPFFTKWWHKVVRQFRRQTNVV